MPKQHLKRLNTPRTWPIKRKGITFITRPKPGSRSLELGLPLNVVMIDLIGIAKTTKEVKHILYNNEVLVDGKRRKEHRFFVGFMDIINFPKIKKAYRIIITESGKLASKEIKDKENSSLKIVKIKNKVVTKKKKMQLCLSDGRTILYESGDYKTGDSLLLEVPEQKIKDTLKLEKGALIFLTGGKHIGKIGNVESVDGKKIFFKIEGGNIFETYKRYSIVIGKGKPALDISA